MIAERFHPPLKNINILDLSSAIAGPMAAKFAADFGAKVIHCENISGDLARGLPPHVGKRETSLYFASANTNKRSIGLDIQEKKGREVLEKLVKSSDVVIMNIPSHASMKKLKLNIQELESIKPGIIVIAISLLGLTGPMAGTKGYDLWMQAFAASMYMTGSPKNDHPHRSPGPIVDVMTAMNAFSAILLALRQREQMKKEKSQLIDVSLLNSFAPGLFNLLTEAATLRINPTRFGDKYPYIEPYSVYKAKNKWIVVAVASQNNWRAFCKALNREDLIKDPRFMTSKDRVKNRNYLDRILKSILKTRRAEYWQQLFAKSNVPVQKVQSTTEFLSHPQTIARKVMTKLNSKDGGVIEVPSNPLICSGLSMVRPKFPPGQGEHTNKILRELGYHKNEIEELRKAQVVA